jgi:uncharacterized protein (DUF486 family)
VPANRVGSAQFSLAQLKVMRECITILVFTIIARLLFRKAELLGLSEHRNSAPAY